MYVTECGDGGLRSVRQLYSQQC